MIDDNERGKIAVQFLPNSKLEVQIAPLGRGNINDTFLVEGDGHSFVLQRINGQVFPDSAAIVHNFCKISAFLGHPDSFSVAAPLLSVQGEPFVVDSQQAVWRAQEYIPHPSCRSVETVDQARSIGQSLGRFHRLLATFPVEQLNEPLPGFHDLCRYLQQFDTFFQRDTVPYSRCDSFCLQMIERFRGIADFFPKMRAAGLLRLQPVHGDPKCDNFIFDDAGLACGMLDLDTVGPGLVQYDLGDCLRSCCNRGGEEGEQVKLDGGLYRALLSGYFMEAEAVEWVYEGVLYISFELGLRFFLDHLRGNRYFRVGADGDNLRRARQQFRLVEEITVRERELRYFARLAACPV